MEGFLNPEKVLDELDLKTGMIAAEFGCGAGGFTLPLAKRLKDGLVYALDIQEAPLLALRGRAQRENIVNIKVIRCDLEKSKGSTLNSFYLDLVLIPNVLFQIDDKDAIIAEAERVLKNKAKLAIIDWLPEANQGPAQKRVSPDEVKKILDKKGFKLEKEFSAGKFHWGLIFKKP